MWNDVPVTTRDEGPHDTCATCTDCTECTKKPAHHALTVCSRIAAKASKIVRISFRVGPIASISPLSVRLTPAVAAVRVHQRIPALVAVRLAIMEGETRMGKLRAANQWANTSK